MNSPEVPSTRPYLIRALYEWCTDNGLTPYVAVAVDETVQVPKEYVKNGEIVLNISFDATSALKLGNDFIEFKARFAGIAREICVPVHHVIAIYARENGQGMAFPAPLASGAEQPGGGRAVPVQRAGAQPVESSSGRSTPPEGVLPLQRGLSASPVQGVGEGGVVVSLGADQRQGDSGGDRPQPPRPAGPNKPSLRRIK